ncbi:MAG: 16S rRNA (guanine(527)-N(7))-methyltransferase RsmG [Lactobacillus sp.]|uniref:Ribosomal RNA small subunit methyltransferase G n=1 Tax=Lactobacillus porci TaxID=2012477 RepID=A0A6A8MDM8_9LACO|nr:16S rRNA (guanine(527)-N(7))-methyltransferase RsmG [Lactobacillus porci]MDD6415930.1 16S rRNA (guanine(527)-N(7))-methyltransferase RsmG [Lactobacillus porci]MST86770.1 16S rRNA (guanine(527)-N(7))-methyltransferase RsmG [Lactobacillus porci]
MNPELFATTLSNHNLKLSAKQEQQFKTYFKELITVNEHVNLTRITEEDEVYLKHFYDSLTPLLLVPEVFTEGAKVCDVGAGAGFPSLPIKILRPDLRLTIVDSLGKRLKFLQELLDKLEISGVELVHGRAEDVGQNPAYREQFDLVTARAVARMSVLSEYCLPLAKTGGKFVALKGPKAASELADAKKALDTLGGKVSFSQEFTLAGTEEERTIVVVDKVKKTPAKYPRQAGTPNRKPL